MSYSNLIAQMIVELSNEAGRIKMVQMDVTNTDFINREGSRAIIVETKLELLHLGHKNFKHMIRKALAIVSNRSWSSEMLINTVYLIQRQAAIELIQAFARYISEEAKTDSQWSEILLYL